METMNGTVASKRISIKTSKLKSKTSRKRLKRSEVLRATSFFGLAVCGLAVSLPHLASEIDQLTGASALAAWFLAVVIDCGMIATKAHLSANGHNKRVAWSVVASCTGLSIVLNSHAFLAHAGTTFGTVAAIGFGVFLPLFILALSFLGSEILNGKRG